MKILTEVINKLERIATALEKIANIESLVETEDLEEIEVVTQTTEEIAEEEINEMKSKIAARMNQNKSNSFFEEDDLTIEELERL